jgi:hypothetical protein
MDESTDPGPHDARGVCFTLDEIGKFFGISRERVRQIERGAMEKLRRRPELLKLFEELIEEYKARQHHGRNNAGVIVRIAEA